ncbi:tetratricopeptide repeat protein [Qipengyuania sp.]|uniref:tetratricopeptide repeat protein n=1 Tax=Qipengyuania sp. TaxID=2004515 RepID=UPI0035C7E200
MPAALFLPLLLAQVGVDPSQGGIPGIPDELRDRPPRTQVTAPKVNTRMAQCLQQTLADPEGALAAARDWRGTARGQDRALAAQCQGLSLVKLSRYAEAQAVFASARSEAGEDSALAARLGAMAANAALVAGDAGSALGLGTAALGDARVAGDPAVIAGIERDRARALVALGRLDEAEAALEAARSAEPANAETWLLSATLARRQGDLAQAQTQIERAAEFAPRDPEIGLEAGVIAALSGREADARKSFQSVLDVAPESEQAAQAKAYLEQFNP